MKEILLPSGEKISFSYEAYSYSSQNNDTQTIHERANGDRTTTTTYTRYRKALRLQQITFPGGKVVFTKSAVKRYDLNPDYPLEKIEIYQKGGSQYSLYKAFKLKTNNPAEVTSESKAFRLLLRSVTEIDKNGVEKPPYSFEYYNEQSLPNRDSNAQDLWGYYNGHWENTTLIPAFINGVELPGAVRTVNPETSKFGVLNLIKYPTGGYTTFDYETHTAVALTQDAQNQMSTTMKGVPVYHNISVVSHNTDGNTESFSPEVTIANPNATATNVRVTYTFYDDELTNAYTALLSQNPFINITLQKRQSDGTFLEYPTGIPSATNSQIIPIVEPGIYRLRVKWTGDESYRKLNATVQFALNWETYEDQTVVSGQVMDVGGLRIKEMTDFSDKNVRAKTTRYNYDLNGKTSGLVRSVPVYFFGKNEADIINGTLQFFPNTLVRSSVSQSPLLTSQGASVGYQKVTVYNVETGSNNTNGSTEYTFTSPLDTEFADEAVPNLYSYPFAPATTREWGLGLTKEVIINKLESGIYKPVRKEHYEYVNQQTCNADPGLVFSKSVSDKLNNSISEAAQGGKNETCSADFKVIKNLKIYLDYFVYRTTQSEVSGVLNPVKTETAKGGGKIYDLRNGLAFLKKKVTTEYDTFGNEAFSRIESFTFDARSLQNASEGGPNSRGEVVSTLYRYAQDLYDPAATSGDALIIKNLVEKYNKCLVPVEKYVVKTEGNQNFLLGSTLYKYDANVPMLSQVYVLELAIPLLLPGFEPVRLDGNRELVADSRYKPLITYSYDQSTHNILQQARTGGANSSMLWGYENNFPIATATNAANNEILYLDFESGGSDPNAHTGKGTGPHNYSVSFTLPNAKPYMLTYWYRDAGGVWHFSGEIPYAGPSTVLSLGDVIDDVRIYPKDAQMTTYTYDPFVGITSSTDAKGLTTYYDYDSFGRLLTMRNGKGEIMKKYDYHFKGQPLN